MNNSSISKPELDGDSDVHLIHLHFSISELLHWLNIEPGRKMEGEEEDILYKRA